jgi:hypothetical protein
LPRFGNGAAQLWAGEGNFEILRHVPILRRPVFANQKARASHAFVPCRDQLLANARSLKATERPKKPESSIGAGSTAKMSGKPRPSWFPCFPGEVVQVMESTLGGALKD